MGFSCWLLLWELEDLSLLGVENGDGCGLSVSRRCIEVVGCLVSVVCVMKNRIGNEVVRIV